MKNMIKGFGFSGYRSFGDDLVKITPLKKINLIIGQNNTGKSNIINFLNEYYAEIVKTLQYSKTNQNFLGEVRFEDINQHKSTPPTEKLRIGFPFNLNEDLVNQLPKEVRSKLQGPQVAETLADLISSDIFRDKNGYSWIVFETLHQNKVHFDLKLDTNALFNILGANRWQDLYTRITGRRTNQSDELVSKFLWSIAPIPDMPTPEIHLIPAIRRVGDAGSQPEDYSGEGIIERLAHIQNPPLSGQVLKEKFDLINDFVRKVLENSSATLEIPYDRDMILVHMDGKTLPLSSHGTGIHEVVILAAASTILDNSVLCIEEPELHLHPILQRKLINYLAKNTTNQYFITTHSAHLMDSVPSEIFHVTYKDGNSYVNAISSTKEKSNICNDLGYKASDILQSNCIIWVEGPSDRIYLNYWLKYKDKDLIEGVHYSIMFYGGKLFSHLTGSDPEEMNEQINNFISLRRLNRNAVIIFDSDKQEQRARINATKMRLQEEFDKGPGHAWVTKGREIENYLAPDQVEKSVKAVHKSAEKIVDKEIWSNLLKYQKKGEKKEERTADKVETAKHYIENYEANLDILDLKKQVKKLVDFIKESNGDKI